MPETFATWRPAFGGFGATVLTEVDDEQKFTLGLAIPIESSEYGGGEAIYLKGSASTVAGSVCVFSGYTGTDSTSWLTDLAVANDVGGIGIALAATVADKFGWFQIGGTGIANVAASFAAGNQCYLTSTDGTIDDAVVAGDAIHGMTSGSAIDTPLTGKAYVNMWTRPHVSDVAT